MDIKSELIPEPEISEEIIEGKAYPTSRFFTFLDMVRRVIIALDEQKIEDAPQDGKNYVRKDGAWVEYP